VTPEGSEPTTMELILPNSYQLSHARPQWPTTSLTFHTCQMNRWPYEVRIHCCLWVYPKMEPSSLPGALLLTRAWWAVVKSSALHREQGAIWDVNLYLSMLWRMWMMCLPDLSELTCLEKGLTLQCDGRDRHPHIKHSRENVFLFGEAVDIWRQPEEASCFPAACW
jgi:hypothetical protein